MVVKEKSSLNKANPILGYIFLGIGIVELLLIIFQGKNYWMDVCIFFSAAGINLLSRKKVGFKGRDWIVAILFVILLGLIANKIFFGYLHK